MHTTSNRPLGVRRWLLPLTALLFFGSGVSALIYQTLWLRLLALVFGVTVHAASTVLAGFMTGLALGSVLASRVAHRVQRPLVWFGVAELLIGFAALATPMALDLAQRTYVALHPRLGDGLGLVTLARFVMAFAVLIVPTLLMGATLPLVMHSSLTRRDRLGSRISLLYASNTGGAIVGALLAGFYLVPFMGLRGSFMSAAALNVLVGLIAIAMGRGLTATATGPVETAAPVMRDSATDGDGDGVLPRRTRWIVLAVFAGSGFASLALEVLWCRVLVIFLRPTTYAFTIMLANVLGGIALGSACVAPLMKRRLDWLAVLAVLELALAVVVLSSFTMLGWSLDVTPRLAPHVEGSRSLAYLLPLVLAGFFAILPAAFLLGAAFPVGVRLWSTHEETARIGVFYAVNVCGALVGSLCAGFLLIPRWGSQTSLVALAAISLVSGLALLPDAITRHATPRRRVVMGSVGAFAVVVFAALAIHVPNPFDLALARLHPGERLLSREEGVQTTVSIHKRGRQRIMYLDGHHQANDTPGTTFVHQRIGFLPVALHPDPKRALVIGLGGGATPGAVARFPGVQVDVVELSQSVINGAREFASINLNLLQRPNVRLRLDDGRNFLLLSKPGQYDVITADVILPHHAGAGNLYSAEYFRLMRRALRNDGLVLQWNGSVTETEYRLQLRTFMSVFPHTTLWGDGSLMVGSKRPFTLSRGAHDRKLARADTREALRRFTVADFDRLIGQYVAGPDALRALAGDGPILTDDRPRLEYFLSLPREDGPIDLSGLSAHPGEIVRQ